MSAVKFSNVCVLEWLQPSDRKTGRNVFEYIESLEILHGKGLRAEYLEISSIFQLENHLDLLTKRAVDLREIPVLELEMHGTNDKKSLALNSGECVDWMSLEEQFRGLNIAC